MSKEGRMDNTGLAQAKTICTSTNVHADGDDIEQISHHKSELLHESQTRRFWNGWKWARGKMKQRLRNSFWKMLSENSFISFTCEKNFLNRVELFTAISTIKAPRRTKKRKLSVNRSKIVADTGVSWKISGGYWTFLAKFRHQRTYFADSVFKKFFCDWQNISRPNPVTMPLSRGEN